ncbi:MAG: hypothetical protein ACRENK_16515 [Gemmatimonadaceae bacterium]
MPRIQGAAGTGPTPPSPSGGGGGGGSVDMAELVQEFAPYEFTTPGNPGPQLGPNFTGGPFTISAGGSFTLATIPLDDDSDYSITYQVTVRDTANNRAKWKDSQDWGRGSGGVPTLLGTSDGPAPVVNSIATLANNWMALVQSGNNVLLQITTLNTQHINVIWDVYIVARQLPVAL